MNTLDLPIIVADSSAIIDLTKIETAGDGLPASRGGGQFSVSKVIDELCINGNRTLMIPGSVLTELFPTVPGRLTLAQDEQGKATFPLGISQKMFPHPHENTLYQYLSDLAQDGLLRCYNSPEEMITAQEITRPRGGVVIVSMGEKRDPHGHLFSEDKNERAMTPPGAPHLPQVANLYKDMGDIDVCNLLVHIDEHVRSYKIKGRVMLLNTDGGLYKRLEKTGSSRVATYMKPGPLVQSMSHKGKGMLDRETEEAFGHASVEHEETDRFGESRRPEKVQWESSITILM